MRYLKVFLHQEKFNPFVHKTWSDSVLFCDIQYQISLESLDKTFFFLFDQSFNFIVNLPSWLQKIVAAEMPLLWDTQKELVKDPSKNVDEISWIKIICMINVILTAYCHITPDLSSFGVQKILA